MTGSPEDQKTRQDLYAAFAAEIHRREFSGSENFDKSVLTLSAGGLAASIAFLKDFVHISIASAPWTLYGSWILFTMATCATMASFLVSSKALAFQRRIAERYYLEREEEAWSTPNPWDQWTRWLNRVSGCAFLLAMVLSVLFTSLNLSKARVSDDKGEAMQKIINQPAPRALDIGDLVQRGQTAPVMQKVPVSSPIAPTAPASAPTSAPASSPSAGSQASQ